MKFKVYYFFIIFAVFFSTETFAQVDRSIGNGQYRRPKSKTTTGPYDYVAETAKYYQKELTLDDFQVAAIKEILTSEKEAIGNIRDQDLTKEERRDKASEINERIDSKIKPLLNPDQLKKYQALIDKRKG